jgi:predicted metalloprotease
VRTLTVVLLALAVGLTAGCGSVDDAKRDVSKKVQEVKKKVQDKAQQIGKDLDRLRGQIADKVNTTLAKIKGVLPKADEDTPPPPSLRASNTFDVFLDQILGNVNSYWTKTFKANRIPAPHVGHHWIHPGDTARSRCGKADDQSAFYCPADDTIYFGEGIGQDIYDNIGDFGVAYAVAHEYGHNVQEELGWYAAGIKVTTVAPFELQADCLAGDWGYAVYKAGLLDAADVQEAVKTAYAVGDFDFTNPQHHGTPTERQNAWLKGYHDGNPADCRSFVKGL